MKPESTYIQNKNKTTTKKYRGKVQIFWGKEDVVKHERKQKSDGILTCVNMEGEKVQAAGMLTLLGSLSNKLVEVDKVSVGTQEIFRWLLMGRLGKILLHVSHVPGTPTCTAATSCTQQEWISSRYLSYQLWDKHCHFLCIMGVDFKPRT